MGGFRCRWGNAVALLAVGCSTPLGLSEVNEEGFFSNGSVDLHYVIDFPTGEGPFPAVVFVHGSGRKSIQDYAGIASRFIDRGIAVLRYDKRGVGDSGGTFTPSNVQGINTALPRDYATDAAAAFEVLAAHPQVDPTKAGLMGESQAGWTIPAAAVAADGVSFVVLLSGPTMALGNVGAFEQLANDRPDLSSDEVMAQLEQDGRLTDEGFDPTPHLRAMEMPGLWVFGARDVNVPGPASARVLESLNAELSKDFTSIVYSNGDHGLRDADSGEGIPYWDDVVAWLDARGLR